MSFQACHMLSSKLGPASRLWLLSQPRMIRVNGISRSKSTASRALTKPPAATSKSTKLSHKRTKPIGNNSSTNRQTSKTLRESTPDTIKTIVPQLEHPIQETYASIEFTNKTKKYPERLLVYHGGTLSTSFIGIQKISSIFCFVFLAAFLAPSYAQQVEEPLWRPLLITCLSPLPILLTARTTRPFTCYIHLLLPPTARTSQTLPQHLASPTFRKTAQLEITTMNLLGRPRISRMFVSELRPLKTTIWRGAANFGRSVGEKEKSAERRWWQPRLMSEFAFRKGCGMGPAGKGAWERILGLLETQGKEK